MKQRLIVIAGPTASGKTACAVELCRNIGGEVISADSMQLYRGMDVLSARPTEAETRGVPHHMIGVAAPSERYSVARYREEARRAIAAVASRGHACVLCGGTGLYIDALTRPMDFSERDEELRMSLIALAEKPSGRRELHAMLEACDPEAAARLHENDVRRVSRAIEAFRLTGKTQAQRLTSQGEGPYDARIFALNWPREALYRRIDRRVDEMLDRGMVDEVRALMADPLSHPTAVQAIGYKEIAAALEGRVSMADAISLVKQLSRNYAKKQMTWFRRDARVQWIEAEGRAAEEIAREIQELLEADAI